MKLKIIFRWIYDKINNYNLFIREENEYDDDDNSELKDPAIVLNHQKYATRLYILILMC